MDHTRDPCPWVALNDFGGAFCMGVCDIIYHYLDILIDSHVLESSLSCRVKSWMGELWLKMGLTFIAM